MRVKIRIQRADISPLVARYHVSPDASGLALNQFKVNINDMTGAAHRYKVKNLLINNTDSRIGKVAVSAGVNFFTLSQKINDRIIR